MGVILIKYMISKVYDYSLILMFNVINVIYKFFSCCSIYLY